MPFPPTRRSSLVIPAADLDESGEITVETILDRIENRLRPCRPGKMVRHGDRITFDGGLHSRSRRRDRLTAAISRAEVQVQREGESFRLSYTFDFDSLLPVAGVMGVVAGIFRFGMEGSVAKAILFAVAIGVAAFGWGCGIALFQFPFLLRRWALDLWHPLDPRP